MPTTLDQLIPALSFLASAGGAGWLASALFAAARRRVPRPAPATWAAASPQRRALWRLLYAPLWARLTVFALAAAIAVGCSAALAAATGQPVAPALDAALAVVVSQVVHALGLPARPVAGE